MLTLLRAARSCRSLCSNELQRAAGSGEVEQEEKLTRSEDSRWHRREERGEDSQPATITAAPAWDGAPGLGE